MPRIESICIFRLFWAAWEEDDLQFRNVIRYGFSEDHARRRVLRSINA